MNHFLIKILFTTICGIFIPHIAGLLCTELTPPKFLLISYIYYSIMMFILWQGNQSILLKVGLKFQWTKEPIKKLITLLFYYFVFTSCISLLFTIVWYSVIVQIDINWSYIFNIIFINIILVLTISHIHETKQLILKTIVDKELTDQIELSIIKSELNALKSQIDPHFIFNSLNTLSFLIEHDEEKALKFNNNLADLYRYILTNKNKGLVSLESEIDIAKKYFSLMKIRFGDDISLNIDPEVLRYYDYKIPAISLQVLIENAIKHNKFNQSDNLNIRISVFLNKLVITNTLNKKYFNVSGTGIGLENLNKRYHLLTNNEISTYVNENKFTVELPILSTSNNESFNRRG